GQAPGGASGGGAGAGGAGTAAVPVTAIGIGVGALAVAAAAAVAIALAPSWSAPAEPAISADATTTDREDAADAVDAPPDETGAEPVDAPAEAVDAPVADPVPVSPPAPAPERSAQPAPSPSTPAPVPSTPAPTPTPTPTPDPEPVVTATAQLDAPADLAAPVPAPVSGSGVAGADVVLLDESGTVLARTTADAAGRFSAAIPGDLLHEGMTVRAVQTAAGQEPSAPSAPVGPFAMPVPTVTSADGTLEARLENLDLDFQADDVTLLLSGLSGHTVAVSVDGTWTGNLHTLTGTPLRRAVYNVSPGDHVIGIRYVDPASGREGRVSYVTLHVLTR
ncbi:hypothetical protein JNB62_18660, partial [Microbacterium jejuense]